MYSSEWPSLTNVWERLSQCICSQMMQLLRTAFIYGPTQRRPTTFDLRVILQERDNSRASSNEWRIKQYIQNI